MGSNTEYIYGKDHGATYKRLSKTHDWQKAAASNSDESDWEEFTHYASAIKVVGYPEAGDINIGVLPVTEGGKLEEVSDEAQWTLLGRDETARLIRALQRQAKRVFGQDPW